MCTPNCEVSWAVILSRPPGPTLAFRAGPNVGRFLLIFWTTGSGPFRHKSYLIIGQSSF